MNRMMRTILSTCALLAALIVSGCTPGGGSIFYILEKETKQAPSNLGSNIDVFDVVAPTPGSGVYYAAAGTIFIGNADSGSVVWTPIAHLDTLPAAGALCNALAYLPADGNIYGGFYSSSGTLAPDSLYQISATDLAAGSNTWTAVAPVSGSFSGSQVISLKTTPTGLLAVMATPTSDYATSKDQPFTYSIWFNGGGGFTEVLSGVTTAITDAWTSNGTDFFATAGNSLYSGISGSMTAATTLGTYTLTGTDAFQGVFENGGTLYVSSKGTGIYILSGGLWSNVGADSQSGTPVVYLGISGPVTGPSGDNILIGCEKYGYYYLTGMTLSRTADTSLQSLALYYALVRKITIIGNDVFFCTQGNGLWKGTLDSASPSGVSGWAIQ